MGNLFGVDAAITQTGETIRKAMELETERYKADVNAKTEEYKASIELKKKEWECCVKALSDLSKVCGDMYKSCMDMEQAKLSACKDVLNSYHTYILGLVRELQIVTTAQILDSRMRDTCFFTIKDLIDSAKTEKSHVLDAFTALVQPGDFRLIRIEQKIEDVYRSVNRLVKIAREAPLPPPTATK